MPPVVLGPIESISILGAGSAFPSKSLSNEEVLSSLPGSGLHRRAQKDPEELRFVAEGISQTMGVKHRAWAHSVGTPLNPKLETSTLELGVEAARAALSDSGIAPSEVGLLLCSTSTPHRMSSTLAAPIGAALGLNTACLDVRGGCSAGLFALMTAALYQSAGQGPALVVGTETFSKVIPPQSKLAALSLADGAGALVLGRKAGARWVASHFETDGNLGGLLTTPGSLPPTVEQVEAGEYFLSGDSEEFGRAVPEKYKRAIEGVLHRANLKTQDIAHFIPHQPGKPIIDWLCKTFDFSPERTFFNVHRHANIGAAGWLVAVAEARRERTFRPGELILLASVGGGMSCGAVILQCA